MLALGNFAAHTISGQLPVAIAKLLSWSGLQCQLFFANLLQKIAVLDNILYHQPALTYEIIFFLDNTTMSHTNIEFFRLIDTVKELRSEKGCPWDKRQTTVSLVKHLRAEFDELLEAIEKMDDENLCEELGDLLYLIIMISQINHEDGKFSINQVIEGIIEKLIRRHPHVFAGEIISSEQELHDQWQRIKAIEKSKK